MSGLPTACSTVTTGSTLPPQFTIDAATGALLPTAISSPQGYYAIAATVSEYRRVAGQWQLTGCVARDLTYLTTNSFNQPPTFTNIAVNGGVAQSLGPVIAAKPSQAVSLVLTASDPDAGQQLRFTTYSAGPQPHHLERYAGAADLASAHYAAGRPPACPPVSTSPARPTGNP